MSATGALATEQRRCAACGRPAQYRLPGAPDRASCGRHLVLSRLVVRRAILTAIVVGTLLTLINQGDALLSLRLPAALLWKVPLTYCVPYCVATWGALAGAHI